MLEIGILFTLGRSRVVVIGRGMREASRVLVIFCLDMGSNYKDVFIL